VATYSKRDTKSLSSGRTPQPKKISETSSLAMRSHQKRTLDCNRPSLTDLHWVLF
nr:hypothetical protein [Tanacetum cinerariifolium]